MIPNKHNDSGLESHFGMISKALTVGFLLVILDLLQVGEIVSHFIIMIVTILAAVLFTLHAILLLSNDHNRKIIILYTQNHCDTCIIIGF